MMMSGSPPGTVSFTPSHQDDSNVPYLPQVMRNEGQSAEVEKKTHDEEYDWEHDPANPRNWSPANKWTMATLVSLYTFVATLASSIMAPGLLDVAINFSITDPTVIALTLSIYLLSFAIGPLFAAPLSEVYGRVWVLHLANLFFFTFNLGCALSRNTVSFIVLRFLAGLAGSAPIACGGGVMSDLFSERDRASAVALYSIGPLIGPAIGPVMGGFIAESVGVQYVFYVVIAISGVAAMIGIPFLRETYAPVIRLRLDNIALDPEKTTAGHPALQREMGKWAYLWLNLKRPIILLTRNHVPGIYYLMFATFPNLFSNVYHFSTGMGGLTYLGIGVGFLTASLFGARVSSKIYTYLAAKNGGKGKPEMRIPALIFGSFFVPVGLFWYGWSAQAKAHFMMPIIGTAIFGFGLMTSFFPIQLYLVDTFTYAASAIAAASMFRSLLAFVFPLFGEQMFAALGYGRGNSLLAGLAIIIGIPFPVWIYFAGEGIRAKSSFAR
ncbi:multidrug resistance protein 4 [Suillus americanus]|nr:multidrug resistance protein 4 [Suillus americanus]